jgi:hypothetical protein
MFVARPSDSSYGGTIGYSSYGGTIGYSSYGGTIGYPLYAIISSSGAISTLAVFVMWTDERVLFNA